MTKCTRPIGMLNGKYVKCGKEPAKHEDGAWIVCDDCKPMLDYYKKKYGEGYNDKENRC